MRHVVRNTTLFFLALLGAAFLFYFRKIFFDPDYFLPRDNASLHFPTFQAICTHLRYLHQFPDWIYPAGVPLRWLANNSMILTPYKAIGYLVAGNSQLPINLIYKLCLIFLGGGGFLCGVYFLVKRLFGSNELAWTAIVLGATSSVTMVFLHQEQALGTMFFVPFVLLCFLKALESPKWLVVCFGLIGISMNNHYPQLLIVYYPLLLVAGLADSNFRHVLIRFFRALTREPRWIVYSIVAFFIGAVPVASTYLSESPKLTSPYRQQAESIESNTLEAYREMNLFQLSSIWPKDMKLYLARPDDKPEQLADLDDLVFYVGPWLLFLLAFYFCFGSNRIFHAVLLSGLFLLALGIHGPTPRYLWHVVPGIKLFRQYYYFLPLLNLHLVLLFLCCIRAWDKVDFSSHHTRKICFAISTVFLLLSIFGLQPEMRWLPISLALAIACALPNFRNYAMWGLIGLGAVHQITWTFISLQGVQARVIRPGFVPPIANSRLEFESLLRNSVPINPMVAPKKSDFSPYLRTNQHAQFFWENSDGVRRPAKEIDLAFKFDPGIVRLIFKDVPKGYSTLLWTQWNDQRWKSYPQPPSSTLLRWPAKTGSGVAITRKRFPWHRVVIVSWLLIATCFVAVAFPLRTLRWSRA